MRKVLFAALAAFFVSFVLSGCVKKDVAVALADPTLLINLGESGAHGSGVYIGNGNVLTAAHVADNDEVSSIPLSAVDSNGGVHSAEVLWVNHKYDVALMHITAPENIKARHLSCRALVRGEHITMAGNPLAMLGITTYGQIADAGQQTIGHWASVRVISGPIGPGMSGGPAFDDSGNIVGINVGGTQFGINIIVPSTVICNLMGR